MDTEDVSEMILAREGVQRGRIVAADESGMLLVELAGDGGIIIPCACLETSGTRALELRAGDSVVVLLPDETDALGCVLGRIGRYRRVSDASSETGPKEPQAQLILAADQEVVIRCGASAISLRRDGRILISGLDIVSKAARTQRIKGGSVQIN